jgi:hypothetical protein
MIVKNVNEGNRYLILKYCPRRDGWKTSGRITRFRPRFGAPEFEAGILLTPSLHLVAHRIAVDM